MWGCTCGCCGCGPSFRRFFSSEEEQECLETYRDHVSENSRANEIGPSREEVIHMVEKKEGACGCGCIPFTKKDSKTQKPGAKKPKK
jgi:hypothetical protein